MVMLTETQAYRAMLKILREYQSRHLDLLQTLDSMKLVGDKVTSDPGTWEEWCDYVLEVLREDLGLPPPGTMRGVVLHPATTNAVLPQGRLETIEWTRVALRWEYPRWHPWRLLGLVWLRVFRWHVERRGTQP
jgi:hypothetical protein